MTIIFNTRLIDKNIDTYGAILFNEKQIIEVFEKKCTTQKEAETLVQNYLHANKTESNLTTTEEITFYDAQGLILEPAFIDMHVHYRYPGFPQKEDLLSGLQSSVAGGFGTVVAMPNTKPTVSSKQMALEIMAKARSYELSNMFQSVSLTKDFNGTDTSSLNDLDSSTTPLVSEDGFDVKSSATMFKAMQTAGGKGIVVSCHSEDPEFTAIAKPYRARALELMKEYSIPAWGVNTDSDSNLPPAVDSEITDVLTKANNALALAEDLYTERNLLLARSAGCHVHIAHVSTRISIEAVRKAKERIGHERKNATTQCQNYNVSCEVTPHHFGLTGTTSPTIRALVNPPLRSEDDRQALIEALRDGTADVISTDHAPHTMEDKANGSPGFSGEETAYAVANTVLVNENGFSLKHLSALMSANPARILKLNKGLLQKGFDSDFVLLNPNEKWIVHGKDFKSKGKATPFEGKELTGKVHALFVSGKKRPSEEPR
jgi:dihydroorotase